MKIVQCATTKSTKQIKAVKEDKVVKPTRVTL